MEDNFLCGYELIKNRLVDLEVNRVFNSIGSNVFFEFGKDKEILLKNGKKKIQKEWSIWIGNASWRITKSGKYIVGSGDPSQIIQLYIQKLMNERFRSLRFFSQFLDAKFEFYDGYELTTFFNGFEENQWAVFLSNQTNICVDCSSFEEIKNIQNIAKHFPISENYKKIDFLQGLKVISITYDKRGQPRLYFENGFSVFLENCTWRLEKKNNYLIGNLDEQNKISELIGKRLVQVGIMETIMDAKFQFEDQYVLKTFTCCRLLNQWQIFSNQTAVFQATIQLVE
jgi:hypothetical protein